MTKKEFDNIIPRLEKRFFNSYLYNLEPYRDYYLHPDTSIDGNYFICMQYRKVIELKENISTIDENDIYYLHYKHVQKIKGLNRKNNKDIDRWEISNSKLIPYRRIKIKRILKQLE